MRKTPDYDRFKMYSVTGRDYQGNMIGCGFFTDGITVVECAPKLYYLARNLKWDATAFVSELMSQGLTVVPVPVTPPAEHDAGLQSSPSASGDTRSQT